MKPTEWKDHVGLRDNVEIVRILETIYGLLCNLELLVTPGTFVVELITIKNRAHTAIFLLVMSILILWFETAFPLALICAAFKMMNILYQHESYTPILPDVKANIDFIRILSEVVAAGKYNIDLFLVDIVYWRDVKKSTKLVAFLLISSVVSFVALHLIGLRVILLVGLWCLVGWNS